MDTAITVTLEASRAGVSVTFSPDTPPPVPGQRTPQEARPDDDAHPADDNPAVVIGPAQ